MSNCRPKQGRSKYSTVIFVVCGVEYLVDKFKYISKKELSDSNTLQFCFGRLAYPCLLKIADKNPWSQGKLASCCQPHLPAHLDEQPAPEVGGAWRRKVGVVYFVLFLEWYNLFCFWEGMQQQRPLARRRISHCASAFQAKSSHSL